ncbi:MAG: hypothetical protein AMJ95_02270 [Omnitrophica WOR_2 bacterium SM23_72]|nr:MAG: hypothetical protein AMJ95_02270 [Omnitrophica WOR_2 bacterium SM23_72]
MNYERIPAYPYKEALKLGRVRDFLRTIGDPQEELRSIHVAGTKGKGSTCAFIAYVLKRAGYRVGLYTSPHLIDFRERIRILEIQNPKSKFQNPDFEGMISEQELIALIEKVRPAIESYNQKSKYGPLSFFEVYTSLAFMYFKEQQVDFAVLETGLGGRLDATNAVDPLANAITPISYEHTDKLGSTLEEIATEKAGIIKKVQNPCLADRQAKSLPCRQAGKFQNPIVISAPQEKEAIEVIRKRCEEIGARLYEVGRDIFYEEASQGFNVIGLFEEYPNLETRLLGRHQIINAAVAIGVLESLRYCDVYVGMDAIREGLYNTFWPGRCEVMTTDPFIVLDGAQNVASASALKQAIQEIFKYDRLILVLGISQDKDAKGICHQFYDLADEIILTKADNPRSCTPDALAGYFEGKSVHLSKNVNEAKKISREIATRGDLILVTGSLFVVGEFRNGLEQKI